MKKKGFACLLTAVMCMNLLAGCGSSAETKAPEAAAGSEAAGIDKEQVFRFSERSPVIGLNPMLNSSSPDNLSHNLMYEGLVADRADENGNAVILPGASDKWETSEDGLTYTFHIRDNAVWNDGVPVTAGDFEYTFKKMADPKTGSTNAWLFDGIILNFAEALYDKGKTPDEIGVKAIDEKTLEIKLVHPAGYFLDLVDGAKPVRQDKYEEFGDSYGSSPDKTVVNGPFVIESWDQNTQMTLVRNETYWNAENVKLGKMEMKVLETATAAQAFLNGDIDVFQTIDSNWIKLISEEEGVTFNRIAGDAPEFLTFNCSNKYLQNPKIRLAFSLAIDREAFVNDLRDGMDDPLYSMIPDHMNVYEKRYTDLVKGENHIIKKLQAEHPDPQVLLKEGLKELGLDEDPSKIEIKYATRGTTELSKKIAEWMQQVWREKLGVNVTIDMMEWNIMWDKIDAGEYDIATGGWGPYYNEPSSLLSIYEPSSGNFNSKKTGWNDASSKQYAEILKEASGVTDEQKKADLYLQAEEILVGNAVIAPTYLPSQPIFLRDYVKGYYASSTSQIDYSKIYIQGK